MIKFKTIVVLLFFLLQYQVLIAQKLLISGNWKYSLKDDSTFSSPGFDDTKWKEKVGNNLMFTKQELEPNERRYTLLRKSIIIPSAFKKHLSATGALAIFLGKIHQSDNLYFNGEAVSKTNPSEPERAYLIKPESIRWDKQNSIAIRIRHGFNGGGLEAAPPYLAPAKAPGIFVLSTSADVKNTQQVNKKVTYTSTVTNHSQKAIKGKISAVFYDFSNKKLDTQNKTVTLAPGKNTINFPYKSPSSFLKIHYTLTIPEYAYTDSRNDEYGYNEIAYKPAKAQIADKVKNRFTPAELKQQVIKGWLGGRMAANEQQRLNNVDEGGLLGGYICFYLSFLYRLTFCYATSACLPFMLFVCSWGFQ